MENKIRENGLLKKKAMHFFYGLGGAIVIIGALFKILHLEFGPLTGGTMLAIGLTTEAIIFLVGSMDFSEITVDTPTNEFAFLEDDNKSKTVEVDGIEMDFDFLEEATEEVGLSDQLNEETGKLKEGLTILNTHMEELNDVYGGMVKVLRKK